ncbi:unnamed protein product [Dibothriocephalus latus]|uniref:Uncharacterized protein n=1 Tax=Dibothriocephalus latus TaxID=60516 RepID=A0A3P6VD98_DIBLA|nr:unnamed protein product [Dibothriocephalus latus]
MPQAVPADVMEEEEPTKLKPDGDPSIKLNPNAVSPRQFVEYAASLARSHNSALTCQFLPLRRTETERQILEALNSLLSAKNAFGIFSESPFLRPVTLLRPVQFAFPVKVVLQYSDPENMVRRLRDLADQKVTSLPLLAILSGTKPNAASLGFCTDFLTYSFNLELDINIARLLVDQLRNPNSCTDKYRLILRLAWATTGLYMPGDKSNPSRVLASEVLPRCLSVRVDRRNVTLPDPTFHEGQAQNFGHRLRFAIDITDKIRFQSNSLVCCQHIDIELTWLHAPLQDHAIPLLEMVGSGSCTSILNHLLNLPLVQITLDRVHPIPESPDRVIAASETLAMVKSKLTSLDDLQSDGWIPVSLLCPLALTRIEVSPHIFSNIISPLIFFVQLIADQSLKDAEMAHVDANGHWREALKPIQSDSSAVISIKDSISVITSDNPRITAVPSLLNGPSTMTPCILESNFPSRSVTPMELDASHLNDCILPLGDSNENVQNVCVTQSEQPVVAHPTPSSFCRGQTLPDTVTNERSGKRTFAALDFRPRT